MDASSHPWFQFKVDATTRQRLYVPDRIKDLLECRNGNYYLLMGDSNTPYPVLVRLVSMGYACRCFMEDGWTNFLEENDILDGDVVEMYYLSGFRFRARVIRNGRLLNGTDEYLELDSSDEENGIVNRPYALDNDPPTYVAKITEHYIRAGRLYVPVTIARENFNGFPELTKVQMFMGRQVWDALLQIKYDFSRNIVLCFLKKGVRQMLQCHSIGPDQALRVEFYGDVTPPLFFISPMIYL